MDIKGNFSLQRLPWLLIGHRDISLTTGIYLDVSLTAGLYVKYTLVISFDLRC